MFEIGESAAGGEAGPFEEGGIEHKGATVHEGVVGGFEGFARAARGAGTSDEFFVHLKIGLELEGFANVPAVMAGEAGEKFSAERGGFLAGHGLGFAVVAGVLASSDDFQGARGDGEERFALQEIQKIAVEAGVYLQAVAAVFDDVGIDEAGDSALAEEGFAEALRERRGDIHGF